MSFVGNVCWYVVCSKFGRIDWFEIQQINWWSRPQISWKQLLMGIHYELMYINSFRDPNLNVSIMPGILSSFHRIDFLKEKCNIWCAVFFFCFLSWHAQFFDIPLPRVGFTLSYMLIQHTKDGRSLSLLMGPPW